MLVTQLDATYAHWLDLFLESLRLSNPAIRVYVELVNFHPRLAAFFVAKHPEVDFAAILLEEASRNALAHRKVDAALQALQKYPDEGWYILGDVDLLFRRPLDSLISALISHDAGVIFRDGLWEGQYYDHLRVACGFLAFKDAGFLCAWKDEMARPKCLGYDKSSWFYDQITLFSVTQKLELDYLAIDDRKYINREFDDDAVVWSANMDPKELMYLKFREELERMRAK